MLSDVVLLILGAAVFVPPVFIAVLAYALIGRRGKHGR